MLSPPNDLARTVANALAEDVGSGDLTAALIPAARAGAQRSLRARPPCSAAGPTSMTCSGGRPASADRLGRRTKGTSSRPTRRCSSSRARPASLLTGERTALNFLQSLSGDRDRHAPVRRRGAGTACRDPRHPQDDTRAAHGAEIRGARRRRHEPPNRPVRRHPDQGKPHHRGRLDRRRRGAARASRTPRCRSKSRSRRSTSCAQALDAGADIRSPRRFHASRSCARPSR